MAGSKTSGAGSAATAPGRQNYAGRQPKLSQSFSVFAQKTATWTGHPTAFRLAVSVIVVWIVTGPIFDYSDTWQLIINTGTKGRTMTPRPRSRILHGPVDSSSESSHLRDFATSNRYHGQN